MYNSFKSSKVFVTFSIHLKIFQDLGADKEAYPAEDINYDLQDLFDDIRNYDDTKTKPKNLQDLVNSEDFMAPLSLTVDRSKAEILFMLLKYSIINKLSKLAMTNLYKLVNVLMPEFILPDSDYLLDKLLNTDNTVEFHAVCHECRNYIGLIGTASADVNKCKICKAKLDVSNPSNKSYFVLIDPSVQIIDLLALNKTYYETLLCSNRVNDGIIRDVYDGALYKNSYNPETQKTKVDMLQLVLIQMALPSLNLRNAQYGPFS